MSEQSLFFNEFSSLNRTIFQRMSIWQKVILKFLVWFRKDLVPDYYNDLGLKQLEAEAAADTCGWYDPENKSLTPAFAQDLHEFVKALSGIAAILRDTTGSSALKDYGQSARVSLIEHVFCDLRGEGARSRYPFGEKAIFKLVNNIPIRDVDRVVQAELEKYFSQILEEETQDIDALYMRLVYLDRALSVNTMDFLRRFNINADFTGTYSWDALTLGAASYYLENFYQSIMPITVSKSDFSALPALQKTQKLFHAESAEQPIAENLLEEAWNTLLGYTGLFQAEGRLDNLIRLARRNLEYQVEILPYEFSIFKTFRLILESRLKTVVQQITRNSLKHEMKQLVQDVMPSSIYSTDLTDVGVFTATNSDRIQAAINESLRNVYAVSLMQVFIVKYYKPWVKAFLGNCAVNAQFNQSNARSQLNGMYKGLNKLTETFDKFAVDVHPKSSMGVRISKLLDNLKMNRSDKHLLKVFTDSLNNQADLLVKDFYRIFPNLLTFITSLIEDIDNSTTGFVSNIISVKALQDPELSPKLHELKTFSTSVIDLLNMSLPSLSEDRELPKIKLAAVE